MYSPHTERGREGVNCSPKEGQEADQLCAIAAAAIKRLCLRGQGVIVEGKEILLVNLQFGREGSGFLMIGYLKFERSSSV